MILPKAGRPFFGFLITIASLKITEEKPSILGVYTKVDLEYLTSWKQKRQLLNGSKIGRIKANSSNPYNGQKDL